MGKVGKNVWDSKTPTNFCPKITVFPKKKGLYLKSELDSLLFVPKSLYSLKKSLRLGSPLHFSNFVPKQCCSLFS